MFRFTIRDLLWLTVVVALGVGWWVDRGRLYESLIAADARTGALEQIIRRVGLRVEWKERDVLALPPGKGQGYRFPTDPDAVAEWRESVKSRSPNPSALAPEAPKD